MLKRYLVFAGASFYPEGGWADFRASFDTAVEADEDAVVAITSVNGLRDWAHVIDTQTGMKIAAYGDDRDA